MCCGIRNFRSYADSLPILCFCNTDTVVFLCSTVRVVVLYFKDCTNCADIVILNNGDILCLYICRESNIFTFERVECIVINIIFCELMCKTSIESRVILCYRVCDFKRICAEVLIVSVLCCRVR